VPDEDFDEAHERTVVFERPDVIQDAQATAPNRRMHVLVRMDGSDVGQVTVLTGNKIQIGRLARNQLHLPYEGVSRQHGNIIWTDGGYWIEDLASANGTFVQGTRITKHKLSDGDVVQFGPRVVFRYSITDTGEEKILRQLYESSVKDALTGAFNREYFSERLKAEVAYARRHSTELTLILFDLDHFKGVNDTFGHPAGDAVLVGTVNAVTKTLRTEDVLARYGGEEFAVILRGIAIVAGASVAERVRAIVASTPVVHEGKVIKITLSAGCASLADAENGAVEALVAVADRRLYAAKGGGRNRIVSSG
jgi:diguanylate cyclase (GGDEF)-like protein